ncbi:MAG: hypothetical protein A2Z14_02780 [Chloroflexi bacterium RBG_16_48_8]|nr:MAG: hypothetical protein A2Z14_02780 [Chloroflexi bacterium RBG_16_48_8]
MILTSQEERFWFVRNLALGLVSYMGATDPPVWVENFLHYPSTPSQKGTTQIQETTDIFGEIYERLLYMGGRIISPSDLPEDERRYALAREIIVALGGSKHGRKLGLPQFIVPYLTELQDYFARILLAPDPMIHAYRKEGGEFHDFAHAFLIPHRIAEICWQETTLQ